MKRKVIRIDENACTGCGLCVPNCPEGAIQMIDGKARLISDLFCDGLGACLGHCPEGAIHIEEREAEPYNETKVMENIIPQGPNVVRAHLEHLRDHGAAEWLKEALAVIKEKGVPNPLDRPNGTSAVASPPGGCPGSRMMNPRPASQAATDTDQPVAADSALENWPVQLHLASPAAPYFKGADILVAADCTAFAMGDFHRRLLKGKRLVIACPKLDQGQTVYEDKLVVLIEESGINTLTVAVMEVPCCGGLVAVTRRAMERATRKVPLKRVVVGCDGEVRSEEWM